MHGFLEQIRKSPLGARVIPFILFVGFTALGEWTGGDLAYWCYLIKCVLGGWLLWSLRGVILEMGWTWSWAAGITGVLVFLVWVGLDGFYPVLGEVFPWIAPGTGTEPSTPAWNPFAHFAGSWQGWFFVGVRIIGSSIVVPPLEEVFYRSFLYRFIQSEDFLSVPLRRFHWGAFLGTVGMFGFVHNEWLPGLICGAIYQYLVVRKGHLGDAVTAHTITNFLLGCWVITKGEWHFW